MLNLEDLESPDVPLCYKGSIATNVDCGCNYRGPIPAIKVVKRYVVY